MKPLLSSQVKEYLNSLNEKNRKQVIQKILMASELKGKPDGNIIGHLQDKINYIRRPGQHRLYFILSESDMFIFFA